MNYISKCFLIVLALSVMTACMKTYLLKDGITKVPVKLDVYRNKVKFDQSLLSVVDTGVIYEEFDQRYNIIRRLDTHIETSTYGVYRFYTDGRFNTFGVDRNIPLDSNEFNPVHSGYRGVYYSERNQIRYDLFAPSNQLNWIGKLTGTFRFSGDTLYVIRDEDKRYIGIYIKRTLPPEYFQYKANW